MRIAALNSVRYRGYRENESLRCLGGADALDSDQLLEEPPLEVVVETHQNRPRLSLGDVIINLKPDLIALHFAAIRKGAHDEQGEQDFVPQAVHIYYNL